MTTLVKIPMGERPRVVNCGHAEHGFRGREEYELPKLWCLHLYFYEVGLEVAGANYDIVPGSLTLLPPGTRAIYKFAHKRYRHFFVHFSMASRAPRVAVPLLQHLPDGRDEILDRLQNIQRLVARNALHAETLFWGLLWDVVEAGRRPVQEGRKGAALLEAIDAFVEQRLPGRVTVGEIAGSVGLSPTQVNRVVRNLAGMTTVQLIRKHRLRRAYRLLVHSTMPIKLIALECGVDDLQQFNKLMRGGYGKSPRQLRERMSQAVEPTWIVDRE